MKKIVIIEDDKILREELEILLNDSGYQAEILSDFTDAAAQVRQIRPDLVLLDIILPGANGQYILRQIREKSDVPVIMLTSKDGEVEEIMCSAPPSARRKPPGNSLTGWLPWARTV